jgi:MYXO-CTERM domain-containing protein
MLFLALIAGNATADSGISDVDTNYAGATILKGGETASFSSVETLELTTEGHTHENYAYWSGSTLYMGAEDNNGNRVDGIVEFFWFESSIDRGTDFYVAVIKTKTSPAVHNDWFLMASDDWPVQDVEANGRVNGRQAFRWDWSVPFDNYGLESYGQVTMKSQYGLSLASEGSAMAAKTVTDEATGATAEASVQAKGNIGTEYSVSTNYTVDLWSWYTFVDGSPGTMNWTTVLDNTKQDEENAYYEYFLVMQVERGHDFVLEDLRMTGSFDEWWWGVYNSFGVQVNNIVLSRPQPVEEDDTGEDDTGLWEDTGDTGEEDTGEPEDTGSAGDPSGGPGRPFIENPDDENSGFLGCSSVGGKGGSVWALGLLALGGLLLRRRS